jgi:pentatricopeptide repeat protein
VGDFSGTETTLSPTTQTYNLVLYGLAHCKPCVKNALRAESLLKQMLSAHKSAGCFPDSNTFRQVVSAWTKSGSSDAVENAHRVLKMMLSEFPTVPPDASTYNAIMTMYLRKGQTEDVLDLFDQLACNDLTGPDGYSINLMLKARAYKLSELSSDEMNEIEGLLEKMRLVYHVRPCRQSYNIVIDAWAKNLSPDSANRAESLLDKMEQECRQGDMTVAPDSYTFTSVLNAISRSKLGGRGKGVWAERVFQRMKAMHRDDLVESPTTPVYNAYLNALISSTEEWAQVKAERVFAKMGTIANTRTYNIMIKLYSRMIEYPNGGFASFARSSKARELLAQMENSTSIVKPDVYSYTTVICAYSRSNVKRKAMKAFGVLRRMIRSGIRPTIYAFNAVLTACAHTYPREEKVQAFTILVSTLIMIREWTKPDNTTYGVLLKGCERLLPKDETRKKQVLDLVFRELQFQSDPQLHASMMARFMKMDGQDQEPMAVTK